MTDTPDNLTDEQRDVALALYDHGIPAMGETMQAYCAGRDDERAKCRERVRALRDSLYPHELALTNTMAVRERIEHTFPDCFDATGGESDGK